MTPREIMDAWNREHATGRAVTVVFDDGSVLKAVTKTSAFLERSGTPAVMLGWSSGAAGAFPLARVRPYDGVGDIPDAPRAGGHCVCDTCGQFYSRHPDDLEHLGPGGVPFLTVLCSGRIVKL